MPKPKHMRGSGCTTIAKSGIWRWSIFFCTARRANQKVVVLSNYATPDIRRRCAEFGVDAVFDKSNEIDALVDFCILEAAAHRPAADTD